MTRWLTGSAAADAASAIAADPAMLAEARALLPRLQAEVAPAGEAGVRDTLAPLFGLYPQPERSAAEWAVWWAHYIEDLAGLCPQSLAAAVKAYRRLPGSRFMPLPGELAALARSARIPAIAALGRVREALRIAATRKPQSPQDPAP